MAKLIPRGFFQKRKSNAHPRTITIAQKRFGLVFTRTSMKDLPKLSLIALAETLKRYHKSSRFGLDYSFIRVEFPPLTSEMKYDILLAFFGGKQIEPQSYRKEEVMSQMDSSNKPSAVASLLN
jgi:hypothetical protein